MTCARCGSPRLHQFTATQAMVPAAQLPVTCLECGLITVGGCPLVFPAELEQQAKTLAVAAAAAGATGKQELLADPEQRIDLYVQNVYRRAYLDGFARAVVFTRQNKEGRLRRVRELWKKNPPAWPGEVLVTVLFTRAAYDELAKLLELGEPSAPRPPDPHPSEPPGPAPVP